MSSRDAGRQFKETHGFPYKHGLAYRAELSLQELLRTELCRASHPFEMPETLTTACFFKGPSQKAMCKVLEH